MIKLIKIPEDKYKEYRVDVIFNAYKWDPQVGDHNTVSEYVAVLDEETANSLEALAESLAKETMEIEERLINRFDLIKKLGLPKPIRKALKKAKNYEKEKNIRLMRFDFHPTTSGWSVSEVNSDVPGGFAEASILPKVAAKYCDGLQPGTNFAEVLLSAFKEKVRPKGNIALVHATSYSDDRQVMEYIGDCFQGQELQPVYAAPDHLHWKAGYPTCVIGSEEKRIDAILRFFPLEWLCNLPRSYKWDNYYYPDIPSCNHPLAILTQSKRLPLVWDELGLDLPFWKKLLPKTIDPIEAEKKAGDWIYKPALGRVGEYITIKSVVTDEELKKIRKAVKKEPRNWVSQELFISQSVKASNGASFHLCIGVFTVDGKRAGFYGRISPYPRIDAFAKDIPILIMKGEDNNEQY